MKTNYLPITLNQTELSDVNEMAEQNDSFYENIVRRRINYTQTILDELNNVLNGKIPRNFVINIKGCIGRQTGIMKSSFGLHLAHHLDPDFNLKERCAFTPNELNDKLREFGNKKQIFMLDEKVRDFKISAEQRLATIIETNRKNQLCFILIGVTEKTYSFSDYWFERFGESDDKYLPKKSINFMVKKTTENKNYYRGFIKWNLTPLQQYIRKKKIQGLNSFSSNNNLSIENWSKIWSEYEELKDVFQKQAREQMLTGFNFQKEAERLMKDDNFKKCFKEGLIIKSQVKNFVYLNYPDITNDERKMIYNYVIYNAQNEL